ncbi:MAG TPA: hypothetical protein ENL08_04600, partial [Bacteroidetes bacterium]|nr:hypothetical protein [Bacteroidota bacterium]
MQNSFRPLVPKLTVVIAAAAILLCCQHGAFAGDPHREWLPFSPAPVGQWGGVIITEYDQRTINSDDVAVR